MGIVSFIKDAGDKLFGTDEIEAPKGPTVEEKLASKEAAELRASAALKTLVEKKGFEIDDLDVAYADKVARISGTTEKQETAEKAVLTVGNINGVSEVNNQIEVVTPTQEAIYYTVQSGDWLSKIAKSQYGDANKYNVIFEANKPMLEHPDKIYPGQVLRIPPLD